MCMTVPQCWETCSSARRDPHDFANVGETGSDGQTMTVESKLVVDAFGALNRDAADDR